MKVVTVSNYFNHHQSALSEALWRETGGEYLFIETEAMPEERKKLGCAASPKNYVISLEKNREIAIQAVREADVVVAGSAPEWLVRERVKCRKLLFRYSERPVKKKGQWWKYFPRLVRWNWRNPRGAEVYMLCAGGYVAEDYRKFGLFRGKTYRWGYFPATKQYDLKALMERKEPETLLWCGRFEDWKHPEEAILGVNILRKEGFSVQLRLIGRGKEEEKLRMLTTRLGLENQIRFLGVLPAGEVRLEMERAGIFLFTSDRQEGWGAVLNEAMNSGCAVVASRAAGATPFLVEDGGNGLVYSREDPKELEKKLRYLLRKPQEQKRLGAAAYRTITEQWNAETAAQRLLALAGALKEGMAAPCFPEGPCSPVPGRKEETQ